MPETLISMSEAHLSYRFGSAYSLRATARKRLPTKRNKDILWSLIAPTDGIAWPKLNRDKPS